MDVWVYLTDIATFGTMNSICTQDFREDLPARMAVAAAGLGGKARIEMAVTARIRNAAGDVLVCNLEIGGCRQQDPVARLAGM